MIRILLHGAGGHMGRCVADVVSTMNDCEIAAGVDKAPAGSAAFPIYTSLFDVRETFDVILDFSTASALDGLLRFAEQKDKPLVICTTGYSEDQVKQIQAQATKIPIFFSSNMSLGISLLTELAKTATRVLGKDFDIEIIEKHHNQKIDAPSGTAYHLANAINAERDHRCRFVYDRHDVHTKRENNEIGIHSVRGGTMVGEHEILFAGEDEVLSLTHIAHSKKIFANGAVNAVRFLVDKPTGLYQMSDLITY